MKILVVDDSVVFRTQIRAAVEQLPGVSVSSTAPNGKIALQKLEQGSIDLVTLDLEMPEMDGLSTLKAIRAAGHQVRVIIFSSHSRSGSEKTLEALSAGADDFVEKPSGEHLNVENAAAEIAKTLLPKVRQFMDRKELDKVKPATETKAPSTRVESKLNFIRKSLDVFNPSIVVIASSTGGPPVLEKIFRDLKGPLKCPILIAQHMPPIFTTSLAARIQDVSGVECSEGKDVELLRNRIYVAPGDYHLTVDRTGEQVITRLDQKPQRNSVRPAADFLFESAARLYGAKTMGFVLTGMGEDGKAGSVAIKESSGGVMIQDEASCVVWGMAGSVSEVGAFDAVGDPSRVSHYLKKMSVA